VPSGSGEPVVIVRIGTVIVKVRAFEVLGPGFKTVMLAVPVAAMLAAGMLAVSWELLTKVVVRFEPFHLTIELDTKPVPLTVKLRAGPPAGVEPGMRLFSIGSGIVMVS
jgi:hypothetical protein